MKSTIVIFMLFVTCSAFATSNSDRGKIGLGFQATMPMAGISVRYEVEEHMSVQGTLGAFGDVLAAGARLNIMRKRPNHIALAYVSYGTFQYDYTADMYGSVRTSNNGIGVGVGLEWFFTKLPEVGFELDVGFVHEVTNFDRGSVDRETYMVPGIGIHYYFQ